MRRVAVICTTISPNLGSEYSVAWNFVMSMSNTNELYVIYGDAGKGLGDFSSIKKWQETNEHPNIHFVAVSLPETRIFRLLKRLSSRYDKSLINIPHYICESQWHQCASDKIRELKLQNKIDLVHYLNPIGFKQVGRAYKIKDIPYGWGPISGVHKRPFALHRNLKFTAKIKAYVLRNGLHGWLFKHNRPFKTAIKRCDFLLGATPTTIVQLNDIHHKQAIYLPENGIMCMERHQPITLGNHETLQLIWVGSLCQRKSLILLLRALVKIKSENWQLNVVGEGDLQNELMQFSRDNDLCNKITWHGKVKGIEVLDLMKRSHLHVISSMGEATTTVLFEAMSCAVPTLSLDHCGMAGVICEKCGYKIPIHSYEQVLSDIATVISELIESPERVQQLSAGVLSCSQHYLYHNRVPLLEQLYDEAIKKYKECNENSIG